MRWQERYGVARWPMACAAAAWLLAAGCSDDESTTTPAALPTGSGSGAGASGGAGGSGAAGGVGGTALVEDCLALCSHLASCSANPSAVASHCNPECWADPAAAEACADCVGPLSGEDCRSVADCGAECDRFSGVAGAGGSR